MVHPSGFRRQAISARLLMFLLPGVAVSTMIIIHDSHEGSHALCESFEQFCVEGVECTELYEQNSFYGGTGPDLEGLHEKQIALTALWFRDFGLLNAGVRADDFVVVLVRLDLFRWSISEYFKQVVQSEIDVALNKTDHPDFRPYVDPQFATDGVELQPVDFDTDIFAKVVTKNLFSWRNKLRIMDVLERGNKRFGIASYEQFLEGGAAYAKKILDRANIPAKCTDGQVNHLVHKAHSDRLSDTVLNFDDIFKNFTYSQYPTWRYIAKDRSKVHI